jgi:hypothetical protein
MGVRNIEGITAKLERGPLGHVEDFLYSEVHIGIIRLTKVLNWASVAGVKVETAHGLKGSDVQERLTHVNMAPGLSVRIRVLQEPRQAFSLKLDGHVATR